MTGTRTDITTGDPAIRILTAFFPPDLQGSIYLVGGSVRDRLMGRTGGDIDLFAAVAEERLRSLGFRLVNPRSGADIMFRIVPGVGKVEVTVSRGGATLVDDLERRDFTVNAMAMTLAGEVIDPLGGIRNLENRELEPCSSGIFAADPLRLLRAFRFTAEGWQLGPSTVALLKSRDWNPLLDNIPPERMSGEMLKAFAGGEPWRFFSCLLHYRIGTTYLPELFRMPDVVAGPPRYHPEGDLLTHSLQVLERMSRLTSEVIPRFCAFFHDLGKLATPAESYPRHHGHDRTGFLLADSFARRLRLSTDLRRALMWSCRLHLTAARWPELRFVTRVKLVEEAVKGGVAVFLPLIVAADRGEECMAGWGEALAVVRLGTGELGIDPRLLAKSDGEIFPDPVQAHSVRPLPPAERASFIRARRAEELRRRLAPDEEAGGGRRYNPGD